MDPAGIKRATIFALENGLNPKVFLHDADAKGYKACMEAKKRFIAANPELFTSDEMKEIAEMLCMRHGGTSAGNALVAIAKDELFEKRFSGTE
jgi:hypothetical protein